MTEAALCPETGVSFIRCGRSDCCGDGTNQGTNKKRRIAMPLRKSYFELVGRFHEKFGLPTGAPADGPATPPEDVVEFRQRFMAEELREYVIACQDGDLAGQLDALVDLVYVTLGTAHFHGFERFDEAFERVHAANMRKVRSSGADDERSKRRHASDVVKPAGWTPPELEDLVR